MMINHVTQLERNKSPVGHIIPIRGFVSCLVLVIFLMWPALFVCRAQRNLAMSCETHFFERDLRSPPARSGSTDQRGSGCGSARARSGATGT